MNLSGANGCVVVVCLRYAEREIRDVASISVVWCRGRRGLRCVIGGGSMGSVWAVLQLVEALLSH